MTPHVRQARRNAIGITATAATVGLLFLYPTSTHRGSTVRRPGQAIAPTGIVASPAGPAPSAAAAAPVDLLINGSSVDTPYGPVQVQIQIRNRRIISATAIDYPQAGGRDQQINSYAVPALQQETVQAQSAKIDTISGATYTSDGYRNSLQAALDLAHL